MNYPLDRVEIVNEDPFRGYRDDNQIASPVLDGG